MKILEINAFYYNRGGSETVFFNTTDLLRSRGHQVIPFTLRWDENLPSPYSRYFPQSKETRSGVFRPVNNIITYFYHFEAAEKLEKLIDDEQPDIAQIHLIWGQLSPSILKVLKRKNIPAVLTVHDYRLVCPDFLFRNGKGEICEQCEGHKFWKCVVNKCCRGSRGLSMMMASEQYTRNLLFNPAKLLSGIVYVSDFSRNIHEKYMPSLKQLPAVRLYNTANIIADTPSTASDYLLFFGRLSDEKGISTLVKAVAGLPKMKLKIAGNGPLETEMKDFCARRGIDNIEFIGFKTGEDLHKLVREARFVVVPSECYENNPMTIVEAYSAGVPVIGSAIGGIPEVIEEGKTGFTFTVKDVDSLAQVLRKSSELSDSEYTAMRSNALSFAKENFNPDKYFLSLDTLFRKLTEDSTKS